MNIRILKLMKLKEWSVMLLLITAPASTSYKLDAYGFGSGGVEGATSTTYGLEGISGEQGGQALSSSTYKTWPGLMYVQMVNTPPAASFTNVNNDADRLMIVLNTANNPTDTTYAIAISDDNWSTTEYVQSDNTVGATLGAEDWQTYANWGGASGEYVIGLTGDTTYKIKVKAEQGNYTEGPWGPEASASTTSLTLSFDIDVSATDSETSAPYQIDFGTLTTNTVVTATDKIWIDLSTSASFGGFVYIAGANQGLKSIANNHTISAYSGDLTSQSEGFGVRADSVTQTSGGPLVAVSPFNGITDSVGAPATVLADIFSTSNAAVTGARGSILLKTKISPITPAASDFSEILTVVAAANY